jgi:dihydroneopterin aldolase
MDTIRIKQLEFYGYHGASDAEQEVGHRYMLDIILELDTRPAAESDNLQDTVNYSRVAKRIIALGSSLKCRLLETLADKMAMEILKEYPVDSVTVHVRKLHPPMNAIVESVGVKIRRTRADIAGKIEKE